MYAFNPRALETTSYAIFAFAGFAPANPALIEAAKAALENVLQPYEEYRDIPVWEYRKEESFKKDSRGFLLKNKRKALLPKIFAAVREEKYGDALEFWIDFQFYAGNPRTQEGAALVERLLKENGFDPFKKEAA